MSISNDIDLQAVIDTGADLNILNKNLYEELISKGVRFAELPVQNLRIEYANGRKSPSVVKQVIFDARINDRIINLRAFVVEGLIIDFVLGMEFLNRYNVGLDFKNKIVAIGYPTERQIINLHCGNSTQEQNINVGVSEKSLEQMIREKVEEIPEISATEKGKLEKILLKHKAVFDKSRNFICSKYIHKFNFDNERLERDFRPKRYPVPTAYREEVDKEIKRLLEKGIISVGSSKYLTPLVCVKRKGGGRIRICGDYRNLNKFIKYSKTAPEKIYDIFQKFHGKTFISQLDLVESFYQIPVRESDRDKLSFIWKNIVYSFNVCPFGTSDSLAALINGLDQVFRDNDVDFDAFTAFFVDDILALSANFESHLEHLDFILGKLEEANMGLSLEKSFFLKPEIKFLGFIITRDGVKPDPEKVQKLREYPVPKSQKEIRGFIAFLQFYARFFHQLSEKIKPFLPLTSSKTKFYWNDELQKSFDEIRATLIENVMCNHPNPNLDYHLIVDSSYNSSSSILYQMDEKNEPKLLYLHGKAYTKTELNYYATEKEFYAIYIAFKFHESLLATKQVHVYTDCKALTYLKTGKFLSPRFQRWLLFLSKFNFTVQHIAGSENFADYISRLINGGKPKVQLARVLAAKTSDKFTKLYKDLLEKIQDKHETHEDYKDLREFLDEHPDRVKKENKLITIRERDEWKIYLVYDDSVELIKIIHVEYGHIGIRKTFLMVRKKFVGVGLMRAINKVIKSCILCQRSKALNRPLCGETTTIMSENKNDILSCDFLTLIKTKYGFSYLFVLVDNYSGYTKLWACKKQTASFAIKCIREWIDLYGDVKRIVSDNSRVFHSNHYKNSLKELNIIASYVSLYHACANHSELKNREIVRTLRIHCSDNQSSWYDYLGIVEKVLNETINTIYLSTPKEIFFGTQSRFSWENHFRNQLTDSNPELTEQEKRNRVLELRKKNFDHRLEIKGQFKITEFQPGSLVWVRVRNLSSTPEGKTDKLTQLLYGPFEVVCKKGIAAYLLRDPETKKVRGIFHVSKLKPHFQ